VTAESPAQFHPLEWGYFRVMRVMGNFGDFGGYVKIHDWEVRGDGKTPVHVRRAAQFTSDVDYDMPFDCDVYQEKLQSLAGVDALSGDQS